MKSIILALLITLPAWADLESLINGNEVGNGGDVIVCREKESGKITSIELLDYYEGKEFFQLKPYLGDPDVSYKEKVIDVITRLITLDPQRYEDFMAALDMFEKDTSLKAGIELTDLPDSQHLMVPAGCKIEQIAVQVEPQFPHQPRLVINKDLWDELDNNNKAGLILHEIIYFFMLKYKHQNSIATRYFNAILSSEALKNFTRDEYVNKLLPRVKIPMLYLHGINFAIAFDKEIRFHENWDVESAYLYDGAIPVKVGNQDLYFTDRLYFYEGGRVEKGIIRYGLYFLMIGGKQYEAKQRSQVRFYPSGEVESFFPNSEVRLMVQEHERLFHGWRSYIDSLKEGDKFPHTSFHPMYLYRSGALRSGYLGETAKLVEGDGSQRTFYKRDWIELNEIGSVVGYALAP